MILEYGYEVLITHSAKVVWSTEQFARLVMSSMSLTANHITQDRHVHQRKEGEIVNSGTERSLRYLDKTIHVES